jgi:diguanylate cyclase (GGDEF)-like protein/PAS domain S-box-containing protein
MTSALDAEPGAAGVAYAPTPNTAWAQDDRIDHALMDLAALTPPPTFFALSPTALILPMPDCVPIAPENVLLGHVSPLELVAQRDAERVIAAWEHATEHGTSCVTAHLASPPDGEIAVHFVDSRARFGVLLGAIIGLPDDPDGQRAHRRMGPRVVRMRKDRFATVLGIDPAFTRLLGWTGQQLLGRRALELVHPDDQIRAIANWVAMLQSPADQVRVRLRHRHADGTWLWFEVINTHRLDNPQHGDVLGEMVEITDEMAAQEALRARTLLLQRLTDTLPMGVAQLDLTQRIIYRNERLATVLGATAQRLNDQLAGLDDRDRAEVLAVVDRALLDNVDADLEVALAGRRCAILVRPLQDDAGAVTGAILTVTDITESVRLRDQLERRASYDVLTGCRNRESVFAELGERISAQHRASTGVAVVFVDLDRFKTINDQFGHAAGDRLLQTTGDRLLGAVRGRDIVGRIGGDEFLVVASPVAGRAAALAVAQRVARALKGPLAVDSEILETTASIGVAWTDEPIEPDALVAAADAAIYIAKRAHDGSPVLSDHTALAVVRP